MALLSLDQVEKKEMKWLWAGRVPRGAITLIEGDGGVGKSTFVLNIVAAVSTGRAVCAGEVPVLGTALILGEEDDYAATVIDRLTRMGADLTRCMEITDEVVTLASDLARIETIVTEKDVKLIVIDPLSGFLGAAANHEQSVRNVLMPLAKMAARRDVAVLALRHLVKGRAGTGHAGLGSVAIGAVARAALLLSRDPAGGDEVILAQTKNNLSAPVPSLCLRFTDGVMDVTGESTLGADILLSRHTETDERTALGEAIAFVRDALADGGVKAEDIKKLASKAFVSLKTLRKAKSILKVPSRKQAIARGAWYWHMPGDDRVREDDLDDEDDGAEGGEGVPRVQGHLRLVAEEPVEGAPDERGRLRLAPPIEALLVEPARTNPAPTRPTTPSAEVPHEGTRFSLLEVD